MFLVLKKIGLSLRKIYMKIIYHRYVSTIVAAFACLLAYCIRGALIYSGFLCSVKNIYSDVIAPQCLQVEADFDVTCNSSWKLNLCHELCSPLVVTHLTCHRFHSSKSSVFTVKVKDDFGFPFGHIVVKSLTEQEAQEHYWDSDVLPTRQELHHFISSFLDNFLGEHTPEGIVSDIMHLAEGPDSARLHQRLWELLGDHEFLTSFIFRADRIFPYPYGLCGKLYGVEYAQPLTENPLVAFSLTWEEKVTRAIDLVQYISKLDTVWLGKIHLCDVKHDHFGWTADGNVVFLDLDTVYTQSSLSRIVENTPHCTSDEDCSFFDCIFHCDIESSVCHKDRINTNLQVLCGKVFSGISESIIPLSGLLVDPEAGDKMHEALNLCQTNPGMTVEVFLDVLRQAL